MRRSRCTLYRAYAADSTLLYVGISGDVGTRMGDHRRKSSWWHLAARVELVHYRTRRLAAIAESEAIRTEHPLYNIAGRDEGRPLRPEPIRRSRRVLEESALQLVLDNRAAGRSFQAIADELTAAGIPTLTGRRQWYPIQVKRVLEPGRQNQ